MKRTVLIAMTMIAVTAEVSVAQASPRAAGWLACQRENLCTVTDRGRPGGIQNRIPEKSASACAAAGFNFYLPVSELEIVPGFATYKGTQMVRFYHEDDPDGFLFSCSFNVNDKYRQEALLAGRSWGWPVEAAPPDIADDLTDRVPPGDASSRPSDETFAFWTIEDSVLAATGSPLTYEAVATSNASELRIGCFVPMKQSFARAYFVEDLGRSRAAQVWYGVTDLRGEEWNLDESEISLEVAGDIGNLPIAAEIETAEDKGTLLLAVPSADGFTRHEAKINLAGSLPALSAVREKCAAAFSGSP